MTSKEALKKICLHCEHYHQDMCFRAIAGCEEWHKLEKDLEVLEIIKNKPQSELCLIQLGKIQTYEEYEDYVAYWDWNYADMEYTEEEFNAIKEMFKYEK